MISLDEALDRIFKSITSFPSEAVPLADAMGRVLAGPLTAAHNQPPFDASAMDGYAVRAQDLSAHAALRLVGTAQAGQRFSGKMGEGQCVRIFTGAPMPIGADTVIIQEDTVANGTMIRFSGVATIGDNIRARGNDFHLDNELLPTGTRLTPAKLSLAAAANRPKVNVSQRPRLAILAGGDELVPPGTPPGRDQIVASNSYGLIPLLSPHAESVMDLGIVPDVPGRLDAALLRALDAGVDVIVTTGGASVGDRDYMADVLVNLGVQMDFWKLAIRPGKPLMFGTRGKTLIFGLPGNPVSALVTAMIVVLPALRAMAGDLRPLAPRLTLPLATSLPPNGARRHFIRATLDPRDDGTRALPMSETSSGHSSSFANAEALIIQPENDPGRAAGLPVDVILL